jgi:hypothetical protein
MLGEIGKSSTARLIADVLDGTDKKIGILLFDAAYDSMYQPPSILEGSTKKDYTGGVVLVNIKSQMTIKGKVLPIGVSLLHEMGHAKQYIERSIWFEGKFKEVVRMNFGGNRKSNPAKYEIEDQNIQFHEKPVCIDLGLPWREKYD